MREARHCSRSLPVILAACVTVAAQTSVPPLPGTSTDERLGCASVGGPATNDAEWVDDEALCPAFREATDPARALSRITYCVGEPAAEATGFWIPADRRQAFLQVRSGDGQHVETSYELESTACGSCQQCHATSDTPPTCVASGCTGCDVSGVWRVPHSMLPDSVEAGAVLQAFIVCQLRTGEGTLVTVPLQIEGRRDECGVCGGDNTTCLGCDGVPNSGYVEDLCGACRLPGTEEWNACLGCEGAQDGFFTEDVCGVCGGDNSSCVDCEGVIFGQALTDSCGFCNGDDWSCDGNFSLSFLSGVRPAAGGEHGGNTSWMQERHVCAGDPVTLRWHAPGPAGAGTDDRVVLFSTSFGRLPPVPDELLHAPSNRSGNIVFRTEAAWWESGAGPDGVQIYFEYFRHGPSDWPLYSQGAMAVTTRVVLAPPADDCGLCGGSGDSCAGCDGVAYSGVRLDRCGICGGADLCVDCQGSPWGSYLLDRCGRCEQPVCKPTLDLAGECAAPCNETGCAPSEAHEGAWNACVDCAGEVDGVAKEDSCGNCGGTDDSCARGFELEDPAPVVCLGQAVTAVWNGPSNRPRTSYIGIARVTDDGESGPIFAWAFVDGPVVFALAHGGEGVLGQSIFVPEGDIRRGLVVFNRTEDQQPAGCSRTDGGGRRGDCLGGTEYLRPTEMGRYRLQIVPSVQSEIIAAESAIFEVGAAADSCGECGGDDHRCTDPFVVEVESPRCLERSDTKSGLRVRWRAPSNHAEMSLRLSIENGDACRLRFFAEGAQGVPSTTSGESYAVDIEAGEAGCGAGTAPNKCNTGVAIVVLDPDALDSCSSSSSWGIALFHGDSDNQLVVASAALEMVTDCTSCDGVWMGDGDRHACPCGPGFTDIDGDCQECPPGTFKAVAGSGPCQDCPEHSDSQAASTASIDCLCIKGYYADDDGGSSCSLCPAGSFCEAGTTKTACPANAYSVPGSDAASDCRCRPGFAGPDGGACEPCFAGTFKDVAGSGPCLSCDRGSYSAQIGANSSGFCAPCARGTYSSVDGMSTCIACTAHATSPPRSSDRSNCTCNLGYTGPDGGMCEACAAGKFKSSRGSGACLSCPEGSDAASGRASVAESECFVSTTAWWSMTELGALGIGVIGVAVGGCVYAAVSMLRRRKQRFKENVRDVQMATRPRESVAEADTEAGSGGPKPSPQEQPPTSECGAEEHRHPYKEKQKREPANPSPVMLEEVELDVEGREGGGEGNPWGWGGFPSTPTPALPVLSDEEGLQQVEPDKMTFGVASSDDEFGAFESACVESFAAFESAPVDELAQGDRDSVPISLSSVALLPPPPSAGRLAHNAPIPRLRPLAPLQTPVESPADAGALAQDISHDKVLAVAATHTSAERIPALSFTPPAHFSTSAAHSDLASGAISAERLANPRLSTPSPMTAVWEELLGESGGSGGVQSHQVQRELMQTAEEAQAKCRLPQTSVASNPFAEDDDDKLLTSIMPLPSSNLRSPVVLPRTALPPAGNSSSVGMEAGWRASARSCEKCGTVVFEGAAFCAGCGAQCPPLLPYTHMGAVGDEASITGSARPTSSSMPITDNERVFESLTPRHDTLLALSAPAPALKSAPPMKPRQARRDPLAPYPAPAPASRGPVSSEGGSAVVPKVAAAKSSGFLSSAIFGGGFNLRTPDVTVGGRALSVSGGAGAAAEDQAAGQEGSVGSEYCEEDGVVGGFGRYTGAGVRQGVQQGAHDAPKRSIPRAQHSSPLAARRGRAPNSIMASVVDALFKPLEDEDGTTGDKGRVLEKERPSAPSSSVALSSDGWMEFDRGVGGVDEVTAVSGNARSEPRGGGGTITLTIPGRGKNGRGGGGVGARQRTSVPIRNVLGGIASPESGQLREGGTFAQTSQSNVGRVGIDHDVDGRLERRCKVWDSEGVVANVLISSHPDFAGKPVEVVATFANTSSRPYSYFICRAAAPRYIDVRMGASAGSTLAPFQQDSLSWTIELINTKHPDKPLRLQLRIEIEEEGLEQSLPASRTLAIPIQF